MDHVPSIHITRKKRNLPGRKNVRFNPKKLYGILSNEDLWVDNLNFKLPHDYEDPKQNSKQPMRNLRNYGFYKSGENDEYCILYHDERHFNRDNPVFENIVSKAQVKKKEKTCTKRNPLVPSKRKSNTEPAVDDIETQVKKKKKTNTKRNPITLSNSDSNTGVIEDDSFKFVNVNPYIRSFGLQHNLSKPNLYPKDPNTPLNDYQIDNSISNTDPILDDMGTKLNFLDTVRNDSQDSKPNTDRKLDDMDYLNLQNDSLDSKSNTDNQFSIDSDNRDNEFSIVDINKDISMYCDNNNQYGNFPTDAVDIDVTFSDKDNKKDNDLMYDFFKYYDYGQYDIHLNIVYNDNNIDNDSPKGDHNNEQYDDLFPTIDEKFSDDDNSLNDEN